MRIGNDQHVKNNANNSNYWAEKRRHLAAVLKLKLIFYYSNSETATQVMMVPPGVGRRKRESTINSTSSFLSTNSTHLSLNIDTKEVLMTKLPTGNFQDFIEEMPLGIIMTMNAWHLATHETCLPRNFCEYGLNCATFGPGAQFIGQYGSLTMARWLAKSDDQEHKFLQSYLKGVNLENCNQFSDLCHLSHWNSYVKSAKKNQTKIYEHGV